MKQLDLTKRGLKTRLPFSSTMKTELLTAFKQLSEDTRIPASKLLDEAIEDLLRKHQSDAPVSE